MQIKRGNIYYADLSPIVGNEQGGIRPVLIVSNDIGNKHSPVVIICPLTASKTKHNLPTHVLAGTEAHESIILCEQVRTISKQRLGSYYGAVSAETMITVDAALKISLGVS